MNGILDNFLKAGKETRHYAGMALVLALSSACPAAEQSPSAAGRRPNDMSCVTVVTPNVGTVTATCAKPAAWTIGLSSASTGEGRSVVTLRMDAPQPSAPPEVVVSFDCSGAGVQHVWTSDYLKDAQRLWPNLWSKWRGSSQLAFETPVCVAFGPDDQARLALACSEVMEKVEFSILVNETKGDLVGRVRLGNSSNAPRKHYAVKFLLDTRVQPLAESVRRASAWIVETAGLVPAAVPEAALDPLYSTWYAFLQDVHADVLEREARHAAALGMKTMILDDGWQKLDSATFYSATGDWNPVPARFPDMKAHVAAVHRAGLKYMIWYSVPYVGDESEAWTRFQGKFLRVHGSKSPGRIGILDPRFPDVREHLIRLYERTLCDWGFDGVKLDFIDQFVFKPGEQDPVGASGLAGRDIRSLPEAVDVFMKEVLRRLKAINPDVLIEFRQHYSGPAILQYGNMIRAADAPVDPMANRRRIVDLRLTSGKTAVHSDMLLWSRDETPEGAARSILNALFSVIQYSMVLDGIRDEHRRVLARWIAFTQAHRETLLKGTFRPHHAEAAYPVIEAESAAERIVALYNLPTLVRQVQGKRDLIVNVTTGSQIPVELVSAAQVTTFDVFGEKTSDKRLPAGICLLEIPVSGHAEIVPNHLRAAK